ncbi:MAG: hypothetical protein QXI19_03530 [Candidatus Caldarchaeum sp.]
MTKPINSGLASEQLVERCRSFWNLLMEYPIDQYPQDVRDVIQLCEDIVYTLAEEQHWKSARLPKPASRIVSYAIEALSFIITAKLQPADLPAGVWEQAHLLNKEVLNYIKTQRDLGILPKEEIEDMINLLRSIAVNEQLLEQYLTS